MKKNLKKFLSCVMSLVMVISSVTITSTVAKGDATTEEMVVSGIYNLALGKTITANPTKQEGDDAALSDGDLDGQHAATTFATTGTYFQIDLGAIYDATTIDQIVVKYKENSDGDTPTKGYQIQYSTNGLDFTTVKEVDGATVKDACTNNNLLEVQEMELTEGAVRYVRLYYPDSYTWGIQAREIAVLDVNGDVKTVEVEKCEKAAGVVVTSPDYNTLTYNITAGENQEGYKYIVYLDDKQLVGNGVDAGVDYTVTDVTAGYHTIKVISAYNGLASDPIYGEYMDVIDISSLISSSKNVSNKNVNNLASVVGVSGFYDEHSITTAQVALDGKIEIGEGNDKALRTAEGSPQYIVIDLGDYYTPSEMDKVLIGYSNNRTYAATTKIEFSLDNVTYETVGESTGFECVVDGSTAALNSVKVDATDYTQAAVRYVKVTLSDGASGWGYVVNEISLIANTDEPTIMGSNIPEAADILINTEVLETVKYTIVAGENQEGLTYVVSLGEKIVNNSAVAGTEYVLEGVEAGTHTLKVCTLQDGWQSKGITKSATVDGYTSYIKDTLNLALKTEHPNVTATCDNDNLSPNYLQGSQDISAGIDAINDGIYDNYSHHSGYLQTRPDSSEANVIYDLGRDYLPTDIHSVVAMYENNNHRATEYEILFSADGINYEQVFYVKDAKYSKFMSDLVDVSNYTQDTVRYVKYHIINGNYIKHYNDDGSVHYGSSGYHLCELAVMGKTSLMPEKVEGLVVESPTYNKVVVKWVDSADPDMAYRVYVNGSVISSDIPAGVQTFDFIISAGTYNVSVAGVKNEFAGIRNTASVSVEAETTTPKPTTQPQTTPKPTTQTTTTPKPTTPNPTVTQTQTTTVAPTQPTTTETKKIGKTKIQKAKVGKRKVSLKLKKVQGAKGYRIKYATNKKFKKAKTKMTKNVNVVIKKLRKGKKYYFKAQAYKLVKGKKRYGAWSNVKVSKKVK